MPNRIIIKKIVMNGKPPLGQSTSQVDELSSALQISSPQKLSGSSDISSQSAGQVDALSSESQT